MANATPFRAVTSLETDLEHLGGWNHDTGQPGIALFGNAVQVWAVAQNRPVTVDEAALTFNVAPELIRQAVEEHGWMYLRGDRIEHDGE